MRTLITKWHKFCVREKGHLVVGSGYVATTFWGGHNSALMAGAYGVAALMATHAINRSGRDKAAELKHEPKHLARS